MMYFKKLAWFAALTMFSLLPTAVNAQQMVAVNFATHADPPLFKKFGVMNSGLVLSSHYQRDLPKLGLAQADSLRIDLSMGKSSGFAYDMISGTTNALSYYWREIDGMTKSANQSAVLPYWGFCYQPYPLQPAPGAWQSPPTSYPAWRSATREWARHFRTNDYHVAYHEVWNEPDYPASSGGFFSGTRAEYFEIYRQAALGFREGDPDAVVGGPCLAYDTSWISPFISFVNANSLPLDFFGFHAIGGGAGGSQLQQVAQGRLQSIRDAMGSTAKFATTEIHLNEYYSFGWTNGNVGLPSTAIQLAPAMLEDMRFYLGLPDLTRFHFAQGMDVGSNPAGEIGLIYANGSLKPGFFSLAFYGDLPVERSSLQTPAGVGGFAGANVRKAGALVWNNTGSDQSLSFALSGIAFPWARVSVFQVSSSAVPALMTNNGVLQMSPVQTFVTNLTGALNWPFTLPANGLYYLKLEPTNAPPAPASIGDIIRVHHYYQNRGNSHYADFDRRAWTAFLGMGSQSTALAQVGVALTNIAPFVASFEYDGARPSGGTAILGLRLDYQVGSNYTRSVFIHDGLANGASSLAAPWGTGLAPNQIVQVTTLSKFSVVPADYAPANWNGRVLLSFIMRDTGANTRARVRLAPPDGDASVPSAVAWYRFENNGQDSSGNGKHGILNGPVGFVSGKVGTNAAQFNGTNTYVQIPRSISNDFTIAFWVNTTATGGSGQWWQGKGLVDGEMPNVTNDFGTSLVGSKAAFGVGNPDTTITSLTPINDGQWHHVAATRNAASGQMMLYVDGVLEAGATGATGPKTAATNLRIGSLQTGAGYFSGTIDDVRLFDRELSGAEVAVVMNPLPPVPPTLSDFSSTNGMWTMLVSGGGGSAFTVQVSTNPAIAGNWVDVFTTNAPALPFRWTEPAPVSLPFYFYRVRVEP